MNDFEKATISVLVKVVLVDLLQWSSRKALISLLSILLVDQSISLDNSPVKYPLEMDSVQQSLFSQVVG